MQLRSAPAEEVQWWTAADHSGYHCSSLAIASSAAIICICNVQFETVVVWVLSSLFLCKCAGTDDVAWTTVQSLVIPVAVNCLDGFMACNGHSVVCPSCMQRQCILYICS